MARRRVFGRRVHARRSAAAGSGGKAARGVAAVIIVGGVLYLALAGGIGTWIADKFIAPGMAGGAAASGSASAPQQTAQAERTPALTPKPEYSEEITFEAMPVYALQLGAFDDAANAQTEAERYRLRGAAGYIFAHEDRQRVLASAYRTRTEAEEVKTQLLEQQGVESYILPLYEDTRGVTLRVTSSAERVEAVRAAQEGWLLALDALEAAAARLDTGETGPDNARDELSDIARDLTRRREALVDGASMEDDSTAIEEMQLLMLAAQEKLSALSQRQDASAMEISSQIKYTYVDLLIKYGSAMQAITQAI